MDRTSKALLAAIAVGLFLNAAAALNPVRAQDPESQALLRIISGWLADVIAPAVVSIATGSCSNEKICG